MVTLSPEAAIAASLAILQFGFLLGFFLGPVVRSAYDALDAMGVAVRQDVDEAEGG